MTTIDTAPVSSVNYNYFLADSVQDKTTAATAATADELNALVDGRGVMLPALTA